MNCCYFARAVLLLAGIFAPAAFAQTGAIIFGSDGSNDNQATLSAAQATTFTMRPSVFTTTLSPYGTEPQYVQSNIRCVLLSSGAIVPNCTITFRWNGRYGTGGHNHNTNRPPGIIKTQNGATGGSTGPGSPGVVTDNSGPTGILGYSYTSPEASGITDLTIIGVAIVDGVPVSFGPGRLTFGIQFDGLSLASVAGLEIATASNMHGNNNGYATQATIAALGRMAQKFADELTRQGRPVPLVRVTALSLPQGGLFDFRDEWRTPHKTHRFGDFADIGIWELTLPQQKTLAKALVKAKFTTPYRVESPLNPTAPHWHLRLP